MRIKEYRTREIISILALNGYTLLRQGKGCHSVYSNGVRNISIPTNSKRLNKMLFARLVKEYGLIVK